MAEDIDDLLDEVESKFCKNSGAAKGSKKQSKATVSSTKRKDEFDLNAMIDDICEDNGPMYKPHSAGGNSHANSTQSLSKTRKCYPVYLGGSQHASGLSSASIQRACDKLRCTSCDFRVVSFDNYQWSSCCDYLFLRNNIPDFSKLKVNLIQKQGSRAYACQCSWRSVSKIQNTEADSELRWVCGKH